MPVVLMRVPSAMSEDKVGIDPFFERREPCFDCIALLREKAVLKRHNLDLRALRCRQKIRRRGPRLSFPLTAAAQYAPMYIEAHSTFLHAQKRRPRSYFNVVRMRAQAEDRQPISRG